MARSGPSGHRFDPHPEPNQAVAEYIKKRLAWSTDWVARRKDPGELTPEQLAARYHEPPFFMLWDPENPQDFWEQTLNSSVNLHIDWPDAEELITGHRFSLDYDEEADDWDLPPTYGPNRSGRWVTDESEYSWSIPPMSDEDLVRFHIGKEKRDVTNCPGSKKPVDPADIYQGMALCFGCLERQWVADGLIMNHQVYLETEQEFHDRLERLYRLND